MHRELLSYKDALNIVIGKAKGKAPMRRAQQEHTLSACVGKILAQDLDCPTSVPPFDNSQMDGFAVVAACTQGATPEQPLRLKVQGTRSAGDAPAWVRDDGAIEIMTGAMMPEAPYDAVIRLEDVTRLESEEGVFILIRKSVVAGHNVRRRGSDFQEGEALARAGQRVGPELIMACAGLGIDRLQVQEPIRVALLATGRELQRYTEKQLREGAIRDTSGPYLEALLKDPLYDLILHKMIPDEPEMFAAELARCLELGPDLILSTGAVSAGRHDFVPAVLEKAGARMLFHKVAMRPGKPLLFADWPSLPAGPIFFGLPGNPISTLIGWRFFVDPFVRVLLGRELEQPQSARLMHPFPKPDGLTCFFKAGVECTDAELQVKILDGQGVPPDQATARAQCLGCTARRG